MSARSTLNSAAPEPSRPADLRAVRALAKLMDSAVTVPGTSIRVGLDAILGLIPGIGDVASTAIASYFVIVASRMGVPRSVIGRMIVNLGVDTLIGSIPLVGDLFDVGWRANSRNLALLESHLAAPVATRRSSRLVLGLSIVVLVGLAVLGVFLLVAVVKTLADWMS